MKIALVYPGITESGFNSLVGNEGSWMNHGLAILSSAAKQAGHEVVLLDLRRMTGWDDFARQAAGCGAAAFGITMMSVDYDAVLRSARSIRARRPEARIFVGGPHASICPEELQREDCFDVIVQGEGETTFPRLLADLAAGKPLPRVVQGRRMQNLDDGPWADRDLFRSAEAPFVAFLPPPFVTLIAGRGCLYNCSDCQPAEKMIFGPQVRRRSVENVVKELAYLEGKLHFNSFMIHDDCITEDRAWVLEFCRRLRAEGFRQPFVGQSRADIICRNPEMVDALYEAGLRLFIIGFESGSDRVLKFLRKGCTRRQNLLAAKICRERGIKIWANYMLGLPTETKEEVLETYSMLEEIQPYHCSPAFYTPHPGSDLYAWGAQRGIHLIKSHSDFRRNTYEPKIQGPDYEFLTTMLYKSIALGEDVRRPQRAAVDPLLPHPADASGWPLRRRRLSAYLMRCHPRVYHSLRRVRAAVLARIAGLF
ncbi:MAG: radical SAM protein [Thermoguttaceae bacterium]